MAKMPTPTPVNSTPAKSKDRRFVIVCIAVGVFAVIVVIGIVALFNSQRTDRQDESFSNQYWSAYSYGVVVNDESGEITQIIFDQSRIDKIAEGESLYTAEREFDRANALYVDPLYSILNPITLNSNVEIDGVSYPTAITVEMATSDINILIKYYNQNLLGSLEFYDEEVRPGYVYTGPLELIQYDLNDKIAKATQEGVIPSLQVTSTGVAQTASEEKIAADYTNGLSAEAAYRAAEDRRVIPEGCALGFHAEYSLDKYECVLDESIVSAQPPTRLYEYNFNCSTVALTITNEYEVFQAYSGVLELGELTFIKVGGLEPVKALTEKPCGFNVYTLNDSTP